MTSPPDAGILVLRVWRCDGSDLPLRLALRRVDPSNTAGDAIEYFADPDLAVDAVRRWLTTFAAR